MTGSALFTPQPLCGAQPKSISEALALPQFNAMYEAGSSSSSVNNCQDSDLKEAWQHAIVNDVIRCNGADNKVDIAFFENTFGWTERSVDAKEVWNRYDCDADQNIYFAEAAVATGPNADFTATLLRANHSPDGKYSYPAKGWSLVDVENDVWYSIEDKIVTNDFGHQVVLRPYQATTVGSVKKFKKYLVLPVRMVGGYSCPMPTNVMPTVGYMQKVNPFRLRRDWNVKIDLLRGYKDILRWTLMWDTQGQKYDAWDVYQAGQARLDLQLARNILAFLATPITNTSMINGTGVTVVDDVHTGFFGYLPSIKYAGGNVLDFDPAVGYNLDADLEPFILSQDALKRSNAYNVRHGKAFMARLINRTNKMVKMEGLGADIFPAYERNGDTIRKLQFKAYEWLGFTLTFEEWGALSDSRLLGSQYMSNMAIMSPLNGVTGENGQAIPSLEFYQYGMNGQTGDYYEKTLDMREITLCEEIKGSVMQSVMMAVHCPGQHILLNPVLGC